MKFRDKKQIRGAGEEVIRQLLFNGYRVLFGDEEVLEMDSGNDCTI